MLNKFEHLPNGLTVIFCTNTKEEREEEIYIDTEMFNYVNAFNVEWKVWEDSGKKQEKFVGGVNLETDKVINLKRLIGEYIFGSSYNFTLLNDDYVDHRNCNIFNFNPGTGHSGRVRNMKEQKLIHMAPLQKKEDIAIDTNNNVQVIEHEHHEMLLVVDENKVALEIPFKYLEAIKSFALKSHAQ